MSGEQSGYALFYALYTQHSFAYYPQGNIFNIPHHQWTLERNRMIYRICEWFSTLYIEWDCRWRQICVLPDQYQHQCADRYWKSITVPLILKRWISCFCCTRNVLTKALWHWVILHSNCSSFFVWAFRWILMDLSSLISRYSYK